MRPGLCFLLVMGMILPLAAPGPDLALAADELACLVPRLFVGGQGVVLTGNVMRVRREPTTQAEQVGQIFGGVVFDVREGFFCDQGYTWWQVRLGQLQGWMIEADADEYYVEPFSEPEAAAPMTANSLAWSPDARWLAVGTDAGVRVFDATAFDSPPRRVGRAANSVSFKPAHISQIRPPGDWLSLRPDTGSVSAEAVLVVALRLLENRQYGFSFYDAATGELLDAMLTGWEGDIAPPPDPSYRNVVYAAESGLYSYIQGRWAFAELEPPEGTIALSQISQGARTVAIELFPQGNRAVVLYHTDDGGRVGLHELASPRGGRQLLAPLDTGLDAASIALDPGAVLLAVGGTDGQLRIWSLPVLRLLGETQLGAGAVQRVVYAPDGNTLAAAARDTLYILQGQSLETTVTREIGALVVDMVYDPDGSRLAVLTATELWLLDSGTLETLYRLSLA